MSKWIEVAGLWSKVDKRGVRYLSGKIQEDISGGTLITITKNKYKDPDSNQPDFRLNALIEDDEAQNHSPGETELQGDKDELPF